MFSFKFNFYQIFVFSLLAGLVSCFPKTNINNQNKNVSRVITKQSLASQDQNQDRDRDRPEIESRNETRCNRRNDYSDEVSVSNLKKFIDSNNADSYPLQGRCEQDNDLIYITINGYKISPNPKCDKGRWKASLDLTPIVDGEDSLTFIFEHNRDRLCKEIRVAFIGPENYISIPSRENYYESAFYVMKYEAKIDGQGSSSSSAVSKARGKPITRVSHREAQILCQNQGSRYDLIRNTQWQNIALSIEETDENWSQGKSTPSDGNILNCGSFRGSPQQASSDDDDDCASSSCDSGWDENRRTHKLSNGKRIWDICGNVGEVMKDKFTKNISFDDFIRELPSSLKKQFGPKKTYRIVDAIRGSGTWNLGYARIEKGKNMIVRGLPGRETGIFSVDIVDDQTSNRSIGGDIGFRCVYIP